MSTGFTFGAKTTATPGFGTGSITFGTSQMPNQAAFGFGATPSTTAGGFQFGTPLTSASSNLFGTTSSLNFKPSGFGTSGQSAGLFGAPASISSTVGLNFNPPTSATSASTGFGFGTGLPFGTSTAAAAPFNTPSTSAPAFSFGSTAPTTSGLPQSSTAPAPISGLFGANPITTAAPGFSFGASTSSAPVLGLPPVTSAIGQLTFGLGGGTTTTNTSTAALNLNPTSSAAAVIGLGGLASSQTKPGTAVTTQKEVPPKEQPLPNEISQTVEQFKEMVKQQKLYSSDIARCSIRDFRKVEQEIDLFNNLLNDVECQLQKNRNLAEKLKYDTAKCLHDIEIAQRTQDTPPGLQYENTAPLRYFLSLADQFEREMQALKIQIESADKYVKNHRNPDVLTTQDLALGMKRLHETFVALAGRLQSVHGQVESQKETYLNIRKQIYNDPSNPFQKLNQSTDLNVINLRNALIYSPPKAAAGPTPFNNLAFGNENLLMYQQNQPSTSYPGRSNAAPSGNSMAQGSQIGNQASNIALSGNQPFNQTSFGVSSTNFQLQKPPTGNKRGKQ